MNCPSCGKEISDESVFCMYCGHKTESPNAKAYECPDCKTRKKWMRLFMLALVIINVGVCIWMFWLNW